MENFIKIEIKDSFNKKDGSHKVSEKVFSNESTLNDYRNATEISAMSLGSITAHQLQDNFKIINVGKDKKGFWREVLICAIGGAIGAIVGALTMYFSFGIK